MVAFSEHIGMDHNGPLTVRLIGRKSDEIYAHVRKYFKIMLAGLDHRFPRPHASFYAALPRAMRWKASLRSSSSV